MRQIGDRVRIKSLDWYEKNKDTKGEVILNDLSFVEPMKKYCGKEMTIEGVSIGWVLKEDDGEWVWPDEMFEEIQTKGNCEASFNVNIEKEYKTTEGKKMNKLKTALDIQVDGNHYVKLPIQPMEYSFKNNLNCLQHTIIKYVTRYKDKGGLADLQKARHCIDMLIQMEYLEC